MAGTIRVQGDELLVILDDQSVRLHLVEVFRDDAVDREGWAVWDTTVKHEEDTTGVETFPEVQDAVAFLDVRRRRGT